jgi:hypothetical protein
MPSDIKMWRIEDEKPKSIKSQKLELEFRLEEWLRHDISLISNDLLVIGQQVPTAYGGFIDLLAIDPLGNLVILELKRDKTPRDIVAQILDYASWVQELSHEFVEEIANNYFKDENLEEAFRRKFNADLPDVINESHRLYIVAASIDSGTERIVKYLSEIHDVDINVATFSYFRMPEGEFLGRSMLLDEEEVQTRAKSKSKRKPPRSWEELRSLAEQNGVGALYDKALEELRPLFDGMNRTRTNVALVGIMGDNEARNTLIGIYPGASSTKYGLKIMLFIKRMCAYFNVSEEMLRSVLGPPAKNAPTYDPNQTYCFDEDYLRKLIDFLRKSKKKG